MVWGIFFMPHEESVQAEIKAIVESTAQDEDQPVIGWRRVPVDNSRLSQDPEIMAAEPAHFQCFFSRPDGIDDDAYERRLYVLRRVITNTIAADLNVGSAFYAVSMSSRTVIYKGMFLADQLGPYYSDLRDERFESALALVHQRFSTNTFPSWPLAHPYRMICHNGEINTLARQQRTGWPPSGDHVVSDIRR